MSIRSHEKWLVCLYLAAPPAISRLAEVNMTQPEVTWVKLSHLANDTDFRFYVWATTVIGRGQVSDLAESTLSVDCELMANPSGYSVK